MTKLKQSVSRETPCEIFERGKYRRVVVTVYTKAIGFRAKGLRREYMLPINHCYREAAKAHGLEKKTINRKDRK